eukprot:1133781-Rhodomonas_salina.5
MLGAGRLASCPRGSAGDGRGRDRRLSGQTRRWDLDGLFVSILTRELIWQRVFGRDVDAWAERRVCVWWQATIDSSFVETSVKVLLR